VLVDADEVVVERTANRVQEGRVSAGVFTESERPCGQCCFDHDSVAVAIETGVQVWDQPSGRRADKYKRANTKRKIANQRRVTPGSSYRYKRSLCPACLEGRLMMAYRDFDGSYVPEALVRQAGVKPFAREKRDEPSVDGQGAWPWRVNLLAWRRPHDSVSG
jgi:hypothetical protein